MRAQEKSGSQRPAAAARLLLAASAALLVAPVQAADLGPAPRRALHRVHVPSQQIALPPERHVIEVVAPPYSGNFIINGTRFTGAAPACLRWSAGERIKLLVGEWHGRCTEAVFYNVTLRSTCRTICG